MKNPTHQGKLFCAKLLVQIFKKESEVKYVTGTGAHALNISKHYKHSHYFSLLLEWEIPFSKNKQYVYLAHKEKKTLNYFKIDILEPLYITQIHE